MLNKVLFIGNSHTYFENLPWLFTTVCSQADKDVHATMIAHPGVDWSWHLSSHCALPNIQFGGYDFIVVQQKSHPFDGTESLLEQGLPLFIAASDAKATIVFFNTWSEKNNPDGQKEIDDAFVALHDICSESLLAKCGSAWHTLRDKIDLYAEDGSHQNARGAYLNACILAKTIFQIDPTKLPCQIETDAISMHLTESEIKLLQETAAKF